MAKDTKALAEQIKTEPTETIPAATEQALVSNPNNKTKVLTALVIALAVAGGAAGVAAMNYRSDLADLKADPQKVAAAETQALLERVGKIIELPADEQPTVATVADPDKLKDQPFFARAQQGDKVLIYTNARKAILFNPNTNKIVEVAPLNIGDSSQTAGAQTDSETKAKKSR